MIDVITKAARREQRTPTLAELRTLRAWYYYMLQDMFGGVPLVTTTELERYARVDARLGLPVHRDGAHAVARQLAGEVGCGELRRITKGAANAILASLYLNAGVFNKDCGPRLRQRSQREQLQQLRRRHRDGRKDACQAAIDAADAVINSR